MHGSKETRMYGRRTKTRDVKGGREWIMYMRKDEQKGRRKQEKREMEGVRERKGGRNKKRWRWWMGVFFYRLAFNKTLQYDVILREQLHLCCTTLCMWTTTRL